MRTKIILLFATVIASIQFGYSQIDSLYLGKTPPGCTPEIFLQHAHARLAITNDGKTIYFSKTDNDGSNYKTVYYYQFESNKWNGPTKLFTGFVAPSLSRNEDTLYTQSYNYQSYYSVKNTTGWSTPVIMSNSILYYIQETNLGNLYCGADPSADPNDLWRLSTVLFDKTDPTFNYLKSPLNTSNGNVEFYIAKDESYMVLGANEGGPGGRDLYISYRKNDFGWTNPKSLGALINNGNAYKWGPFVTKDNQYLFYAHQPTGSNDSNMKIFWVRFDNLLDSLKHTNFVPWINKAITDTSASVGKTFTYTLPDSVFNDDDGNNTLTISATLGNGTSLPSWLLFNTQTGTFSGKPEKAEKLSIKVTATDLAKATVSDVFKITVEASNGIESPELGGDFSIFPNPTSGRFEITFSSSPLHQASVEIYNLQGNRVLSKTFQNTTSATIDLTDQPKGIYLMKSCTGGASHNQKVCIE
jgi:hypothetical protein